MSQSVHSPCSVLGPQSGSLCGRKEEEGVEAPGTEWSWEISGWAARKRWKCGSSENIISRLIREGFKEQERFKQPQRLVVFG